MAKTRKINLSIRLGKLRLKQECNLPMFRLLNLFIKVKILDRELKKSEEKQAILSQRKAQILDKLAQEFEKN